MTKNVKQVRSVLIEVMAHLEAASDQEANWEDADARIAAALYLVQSIVYSKKPDNFREVVEYARLLDVVDFYKHATEVVERGRSAYH